ncbi:muts domain V-domain-containing protein [Suillus subaureus]|uniref:DNA mismatch repair protein n=1 Tax=Suillus subaureus TaxID=48587 RepID=A0A9P7JHR7_9AGAM|nr:muts domain V-domain-containing protein [Suillus subaureus]KAG1823365.1 muts domain V-domain-containing protein [Suillus subaureus]
MAPTPAKKKSNDSMTQKSLMNFFAKPGLSSSVTAAKSATSATPARKSSTVPGTQTSSGSTKTSSAAKLKPKFTPKTPDSRPSSDIDVDAESGKDTPPTSDPIPIDVDMLTDDEDASVKKSTNTRLTKRKIVLADSDEEGEGLSGKGTTQATYRTSSPEYYDKSSPSRGRAKKPRIAPTPSVPTSDEEDDDDADVRSHFSSRLSKFRKLPAKPSKKKSRASDDDDFIVPDSDSEHERSSSRASSRSKPSKSVASDDQSGEESGAPTKNSTKSKRPSAKKSGAAGGEAGSGSGLGGNTMFLTKAERRTQEKKSEKKSAEDPFLFLVDVRDKDGVRPGEPGYDPRTLYIPKKSWTDFTPFETQFWEIKQDHFDTILFFQKGKFLELYEDDARIGHREFDLKLTHRVKMSMVGVPETSFNFWAAKFLGKGYKVGRVDQAETALGAEMRLAKDKGKKGAGGKDKEKIVRRELNKVYTNGTLVDEDLLTDEQAGHCISLRESADGKDGMSSFGVCVLDSATSQFSLSAFEDDVCTTKLETMMRQLRPKEVIFTKGNLSVQTTRLLKSILPGSCLWTSLRDVEGFTYPQTINELNSMFSEANTEGEDAMDEDAELSSAVPQCIRDMASYRAAMEALGALMWYLRQLNIDKDLLTMRNFDVYDPMKRGTSVVLDGQTLAHVEVLLNNEGTEDGSLHKLLGRCITPFGKRLFRIWLCVPLREAKDINARLDAVEDLISHATFEQEFTELAKGLPDLERIVSRIHANNCKVKDFVKVLAAFKKLSRGLAKLADSSESFDSKTILGLLRSAPDLTPNLKNVESRFTVDKETDELLPVAGKDEVYDEVMCEIEELEKELDAQLKKFEKKLGRNLTWWHSAQGNKEIYLVQTKSNEKEVPNDWVKSSGTKAATRWIVPSLQPTIRSLKEARENRSAAVKSFRGRLYAEFDTDRGTWLRAVRVLAELDCLFSLAKASIAMGEPSCRPEFVEGDAAFIEFEELRHPTLASLREGFVANDVKLGGDLGRIALLTGPNMGGKSTVMRMTATGVIMAQLGMLVPAKSARLCPIDAILTRMGAYDNMFSHSSTFKVELDECCKILRDATPKSLVILDELGRGTSTYDGMAIAGAVLHEIATRTLPLAFFATHYGSLTDDFAYHPNIRNMHMSTMLDDEKHELVFLYKLVDGVASSSFGTHVAKLAGVPEEVVKRAEVVSEDFAKQFKAKIDDRKKKSLASKLPLVAQADFTYLLSLAMGNLKLPDDPFKQRELLKGLKQAVRSYVSS